MNDSPTISYNQTAFACTVLICLMSFQLMAQKENTWLKIQSYFKTYELDSAQWLLQKYIKRPKISNGQKAQSNLLYAKILKRKEETDSCFYFYQEALQYFENTKNQDSIVYTNASIAELFRHLILIQDSKKYINKAINGLQQNISPNVWAFCLSRKAAIETMFFNQENAMKISFEILKRQDEISDKEIIAYTYNEIGYYYEHRQIELGNTFYLNGLEIARKHQIIVAEIDILINMARLEGRRKNFKKVQKYLFEGLELTKLAKSKKLESLIKTQLMWYFKETKQFEKALEFALQSMKLENEIATEKSRAKMIEIEKKYNFELQEKEIKNKNLEVQATKKNLFYGLFILVVLLLFLAILLNFNIRITKKNKDLKRLSDENYFLLSETYHRINNNLQLIIILISDELRNVQSNKEKVSFEKILNRIESISILHQHLYKNNEKRTVNIFEFMNEIIHNLTPIIEAKQIQLLVHIEEQQIEADDALYIGLLVAELSVNSIKHAFFENDEKRIHLEINCSGTTLNFKYKDNGTSLKGKIIEPKFALKLCQQMRVNAKISTQQGFELMFQKKCKN